MLLQLALDTLLTPRAVARRVLALDLAPPTLIEATAATASLGVLLGYAGLALSGGAVDPVSAAVLERPLLGAVLQACVMTTVAGLAYRVGRAFGGSGGFWGALLVVVWLNAVTLGIQVVQLVALAVAPPLAGVVSIATLFWLLWAFSSFVAELHGFASTAMVLGAVLLTSIAIAFALTILAGVFGLAPQGI
jgi:hypothetical protein